MEKAKLSPRQLAILLKDQNIPYTTLLSYYNGPVVPPHDSARLILRELHYSLAYEKLESLLEHSKKKYAEEYRTKMPYFQRGIRIDPKKVSPDMDKHSLEEYMIKRSKELFADPDIRKKYHIRNANVNAYLSFLIVRDLEYHVLPLYKGEKGEDKSEK